VKAEHLYPRRSLPEGIHDDYWLYAMEPDYALCRPSSTTSQTSTAPRVRRNDPAITVPITMFQDDGRIVTEDLTHYVAVRESTSTRAGCRHLHLSRRWISSSETRAVTSSDFS